MGGVPRIFDGMMLEAGLSDNGEAMIGSPEFKTLHAKIGEL